MQEPRGTGAPQRGSVQRVVLSSRRRAASLLGRVPGGRRHEGASADQSRTTFCNAPSVSLYLDQMGDVRACCQNAEYPLGNVTRQSLREIWDGQRTGDLRSALEQDELTLGCQFCRWQMAEENENLVYARTFDHLRIPDDGPTWPQQLELSLSNACNLQCIMCNGDWSSSIRTHREGRVPLLTVYDDAFFDDLAAFLPHLRIVKLLGGEPFLGKESLRVLDMLVDAGLTPEVHVTTNGTQWSPRVERIMDRLPMEIIVSLDGCDAETYESIRVGSDFAAVVENLDRFQEYALRYGTGVHLAHCLMTTNWHRFADFLRFADARDLPVGVNTVTSPIELSLHHLHPDRLDEIVAELDGMNERVLADLGRNAPVWSDQLERLHHRQRALAEFEDVSYYLGRGTILGVPWRRRPEGRDHQAEAVAELERLAGVTRGPVLVVDDAEQVVSIELFEGSTELAGVDLDRLIGRHAAELFGVFDELHGAGTPEMLGDDPDLQHWRIVFDGSTGLVVDAVIAAVVDHAGVAERARIHLAFRQTGAVADAAPVRPEVERDDAAAAAPVDLTAWFAATVAGDVHELVVDGDGVVCSVGPDPIDVVGVDLSGLVGASVMDLIAAFEPVFGALADRQELELPQGADARARVERVTFDAPGGATSELRVLMERATAPDGRSGLRVRLAAPQPDERPG